MKVSVEFLSSISLAVLLCFLWPYSLGAYVPLNYKPYFTNYEIEYTKLPTSVRQTYIALPPRHIVQKLKNGKTLSPLQIRGLPYYAYRSYWHPHLHRKLYPKNSVSQLKESKLKKRQDENGSQVTTLRDSTTTAKPITSTNELAIAFVKPGKKRILEFKKKIEELQNVTSKSRASKAQIYADQMEEFSAKPTMITLGYRMWNWWKGYNEAPAPFYSDPRTFNHPFGNKNKMLKIPPTAFMTHHFKQDIPLPPKRNKKSKKSKPWMEADNSPPEDIQSSDEDDDVSRESSRAKCKRGSSMLYCNGDALEAFMDALDAHIRKKPKRHRSRNKHRYRDEYENERYNGGVEVSKETFEKATKGYDIDAFDSNDKSNSKYDHNYPTYEGYEDIGRQLKSSLYDDDRSSRNVDSDWRSGRDRDKEVLVVLTKKDILDSGRKSDRQSVRYGPKIVYDTPSLISGNHKQFGNNPEEWEDTSLYDDGGSGENYKYRSPHKKEKYRSYDYDFDRKPRKSSRTERSKGLKRYRERRYDELMDKLMAAVEGRILDMDPHYDSKKAYGAPKTEADYEPAPFWPVSRDFTSEERLKYARMKFAKTMEKGPETGWYNKP